MSVRGWLAGRLIGGDSSRLREVLGPATHRLREPSLDELEHYIQMAELAREAGADTSQLPVLEELAVLVALRERMMRERRTTQRVVVHPRV